MSQNEDPNVDLRNLRKQAEEAGPLRDENAALKRQLALRDMGYDPKNSTIAFAMQHYDGEATEAAISTFLDGIGVPRPTQSAPPPPSTTPVPDPVPTLTAQRQALAGDATPSGPPPERMTTDPYDAVFERRKQALRNGEDMNEVAAQAVASILGAAARGDRRVLVESRRTPTGGEYRGIPEPTGQPGA